MRFWILSQFYVPEFGAAAVRLSRLARMLTQDGHDVTVITSMPNYPTGLIPPSYRRRVFCTEQIDGVRVARVLVFASPSKRALARIANQLSFMFMSALRGTLLPRPDAILVESHPLFVCIAGGWLKRVKRAPLVLNVSDLWPESAVATGALRPDSPLVKLAKPVERWAYRDAARLVGMTRGVVEGIEAVYSPPHPVTLVQNAVDLDAFRPATALERQAARAHFGIADDRFVIVHVGNMSLTYDMELILKAAERLPEIAFLFAGGGSQFEFVRAQVEARKLTNVILLGILPHDQMPRVWAVADATVIALRAHSVAGGTLPAKMYEGLATGTPVIAAIRGEGETLLREADGGIVVPLDDADAMVNAAKLLASDPALRDRLAASARRYAEAHLSPDRVKQAYVSLLEQVANE